MIPVFDRFARYAARLLALVLGSVWFIPFGFFGGLHFGMEIESYLRRAVWPINEGPPRQFFYVKSVASPALLDVPNLHAFYATNAVATQDKSESFLLSEDDGSIKPKSNEKLDKEASGSLRFHVASRSTDGKSQEIETRYESGDVAVIYSRYRATRDRAEPITVRFVGIGMLLGALLGMILGTVGVRALARMLGRIRVTPNPP